MLNTNLPLMKRSIYQPAIECSCGLHTWPTLLQSLCKDGIPPRFSLDKMVNQHVHTFVDFLLDAKMCVLNGCFSHSSDNFTSISSRG